MAISLTTEQRAALASRAIAIRVLIDFYFDAPTGRVSFWDGARHWDYDGTTYVAAGDYGEISSISLGADLGAEGMQLKLNGTKLADDSPDPLDPGALWGTIESETYQLRRVTITFAFFDAETYELIFTKRRYAGLIDQIKQTEEMNQELRRAEQWLVIALESVARRYGVRSGRTRSNEDQQAIWPGDTFFKFTAPSVLKNGSLWWGRKAPRGKKQSTIPGSFIRGAPFGSTIKFGG